MDPSDKPMRRIMSEPHSLPSADIVPRPPTLHRRRTTTYEDKEWDPQSIIEWAATLPSTAHMGLGDIVPIIRKATLEMENDVLEIYDTETPITSRIDKQIFPFEDAKFEREFGSFQPLKPSVKTFKTMLEQNYTTNLVISISHALIGSFLSGFNTSLLNVPAVLIQTQCHLSIEIFSSLQSFYCVGGLFGALIAGYFADKFGRKVTLLIANLLFLISGVIAILYTFSIFGPISIPDDTFVYFSISRCIAGIASGISTAIIPTYLGEIAPIILRGEIGTYNALINAFGILLAEIIGYQHIFGNNKLWEFIFLLNIVLPFIQLFSLNRFSKSPQWLLSHKDAKYTREATLVFRYLRQKDHVDLDIDTKKSGKLYSRRKSMELSQKFIRKRSIQRSRSTQRFARKRTHSKSKEYRETTTLMGSIDETENYGAMDEIDESKKDKDKYDKIVLFYIFFISIFLQILQQFSGINSVWYYSSLMLQNAGLRSPLQLWIGNIMIASSNFFGVFIPAKLIEKLGRKWLMYLSCSGMIIASVCLSVSLSYGNTSEYAGYVSIILLIGYVISFALGLGPVVGLLVVEVAPTAKRGTIMSVAFTFNYLANLFIAQYSNIIVIKYYYYPFAVVCLIGIVFTFIMIPETKQKRFEEIQHELLEKATKLL